MARSRPRAGRSSGRAGYRSRSSGPGTGVWILAAILGAIVILVILKLAAPGSGAVSKLDGQPVAASIAADVGGVPLASYDAAGISGASLPFGGSTSIWRTTGGKPVMLYAGGEFCPFCAASRWALVTALARFGHWSGLEYWNSSSTDVYPNTPTFTLLHATLQSSYIDFQSVELYSSTPVATGGYATLQKPTKVQSAAMAKYGVPPYVPASYADGIPFIDVGMGIELRQNNSLAGILRATLSEPERRDSFRSRVSMADPGEDAEYDDNIQVADLNAFNALLAVLRWKMFYKFYDDFQDGLQLTFTTDTSMLLVEDRR